MGPVTAANPEACRKMQKHRLGIQSARTCTSQPSMAESPGTWGPPRFWAGSEVDAIFNTDFQVLQGANGLHSKQLTGFEIYAHGRKQPLPLTLEQPLALGTSADDYVWTMTDAFKTSFTGHWNGGLRLSAQGGAIMVMHEPGPRPFGPAYIPIRLATTQDMHNMDRAVISRQLEEMHNKQPAGAMEPITQQVEMQLMVDGILREHVVPATLVASQQKVSVHWEPSLNTLLQGCYDCGYQLHTGPGLRLVKMMSTQPPPAYPPDEAAVATLPAGVQHRNPTPPPVLMRDAATVAYLTSAPAASANGHAHTPPVHGGTLAPRAHGVINNPNNGRAATPPAPAVVHTSSSGAVTAVDVSWEATLLAALQAQSSVGDTLAGIDAALAELRPACSSMIQGTMHGAALQYSHQAQQAAQAGQQQSQQPACVSSLLDMLKQLGKLPWEQQARRLVTLNSFVEAHPVMRSFLEQLLRGNPEVQAIVQQAIVSAAQAQTRGASTQVTPASSGAKPAGTQAALKLEQNNANQAASEPPQSEDAAATISLASAHAAAHVNKANRPSVSNPDRDLRDGGMAAGVGQKHVAHRAVSRGGFEGVARTQNGILHAAVQSSVSAPLNSPAAIPPEHATVSPNTLRRITARGPMSKAYALRQAARLQARVGSDKDVDMDVQLAAGLSVEHGQDVDMADGPAPAAPDVDIHPHEGVPAGQGDSLGADDGGGNGNHVGDGGGMSDHGHPDPDQDHLEPDPDQQGLSHAGTDQPQSADQREQKPVSAVETEAPNGDAGPASSHPTSTEGSLNPLDLSGPEVPCVPVYVQRGASIAHALWENAGKMMTGSDKTAQFLLCTDRKGRHRLITRTPISGKRFEEIVGSTAGKYKSSVRLDRECTLAGQLFAVGTKLGEVLAAGVELHRVHVSPRSQHQHPPQAPAPKRPSSSHPTKSGSDTDSDTDTVSASHSTDTNGEVERPIQTRSKAGAVRAKKQKQGTGQQPSWLVAAARKPEGSKGKSQSAGAAAQGAAARSKSAPPTRPQSAPVNSPRGPASAAAKAGTAAASGKKRVRAAEVVVKEEPVSPAEVEEVLPVQHNHEDTPARKKAKAQAEEAAATLQELASVALSMEETAGFEQAGQQKAKSKQAKQKEKPKAVQQEKPKPKAKPAEPKAKPAGVDKVAAVGQGRKGVEVAQQQLGDKSKKKTGQQGQAAKSQAVQQTVEVDQEAEEGPQEKPGARKSPRVKKATNVTARPPAAEPQPVMAGSMAVQAQAPTAAAAAAAAPQPSQPRAAGTPQPASAAGPAGNVDAGHVAAGRLTLLPSLQYVGDRPTMDSQMSGLSAMRKLLTELGVPEAVGQLLQRYRNHYRASEEGMREFSHHYIAAAIAVESEQRELVLDALRAEWGLQI